MLFYFYFILFFCNKPTAEKAATETAQANSKGPQRRGEKGWIFSTTYEIREKGGGGEKEE
jgi:hypothetical protein